MYFKRSLSIFRIFTFKFKDAVFVYAENPSRFFSLDRFFYVHTSEYNEHHLIVNFTHKLHGICARLLKRAKKVAKSTSSPFLAHTAQQQAISHLNSFQFLSFIAHIHIYDTIWVRECFRFHSECVNKLPRTAIESVSFFKCE